ncbi:putative F-box protein PP2-B12 [Alnus glutinosa]|uniref:putative F-box protein PP2-B12 n=1 Tax=Alnus glutinosa TaxID=3517 RepID=UPI002D79811C|nr:putative F-box protein PP2-B12 [Alnus glutinosa]
MARWLFRFSRYILPRGHYDMWLSGHVATVTATVATWFPEVAELLRVFQPKICGKFNTCMLSPTTLYTAYPVFKISRVSCGFENQPIEVAVGVVGSEGHKRKRSYCLKERGYGWLEIKLGEFFNGGEDDGEVEMSVLEVKGGNWKGGLIVQGIEIRPKE